MKKEFIPGRLYKSTISNTIVKCESGSGFREGFYFTGVVVYSGLYEVGEHSTYWLCENFEQMVVYNNQEPELNVIL